MTWDVALPKDGGELKFLRESTKHRIVETVDSYGDTYYQGQFKTSYMGGGWWDDSDCSTYDEEAAIAWFEDCENISDEK